MVCIQRLLGENKSIYGTQKGNRSYLISKNEEYPKVLKHGTLRDHL